MRSKEYLNIYRIFSKILKLIYFKGVFIGNRTDI